MLRCRRSMAYSRLNVNPRKCILCTDNLTALRSAHRRTPWKPEKLLCKSHRSGGALTLGVFPFVNLTGLLRASMEARRGHARLFAGREAGRE